MRFTKMHGAGNDYVYVNCFQEQVGNPQDLARRVSDRHFGIGGDGLVLILPSDVADLRMRMFNADGSEAEMCGNAARCVAKYAWDHALVHKNPLSVETAAGMLSLTLFPDSDGLIERVRVDMGRPRLRAGEIPVALSGEKVVNQPIEVDGQRLEMTCLSMGNPHAVFYTDDVAAIDLGRIGPRIENHELFPARVNAHFVQVDSPGQVTMRTWERGSGITLACGTGACAVCVAGVLTGRTERRLLVHLPGGDLELQWAEDDHLLMTGPAVEVFSGKWISGRD
ncbi:MAG: diaminopimelate epimerase [Anaerolineaceae bacterium]|nr:diaminopimelate epimerase [Anaerolineaceae bacterium]